MEITPFPCPACGKSIFQRTHIEGHLKSVNCAVRAWKRRKTQEGWFHAKYSWRAFFDANDIPYEAAPCDPRKAQVLFVPAHVHEVLRQTRVCVDTYVGRIWFTRPRYVLERWLKALKSHRKEVS